MRTARRFKKGAVHSVENQKNPVFWTNQEHPDLIMRPMETKMTKNDVFPQFILCAIQ